MRQIIIVLIVMQLGFSTILLGEELAPDSSLEAGLSFFFTRELGYVLVGEKAAASDDCQSLDFLCNPQKLKSVLRYLQTVFENSKKFIYKARYIEKYYYCIELIHRQAFSSLITKEPEIRAFILKKYGTEERFFHDLEDPDTTIFECFNFNDYLLGLVLGYGKSNAQYYIRRIIVGTYLKK